jgi:hypothetical protein
MPSPRSVLSTATWIQHAAIHVPDLGEAKGPSGSRFVTVHQGIFYGPCRHYPGRLPPADWSAFRFRAYRRDVDPKARRHAHPARPVLIINLVDNVLVRLSLSSSVPFTFFARAMHTSSVRLAPRKEVHGPCSS